MNRLSGLVGLVLFLCSPTRASANPQTWSDLEPHTRVKLKEDIILDSSFSLKKGTPLALDEILSLSPVPVEALSLRLATCDSNSSSRSISLTLIDDQYGIELSPGCKLTLYLEIKDLYQPSLLETLTR